MPNKIFTIEETSTSFDGTAGADVAWSIEGVADGAGRQSAQHDLGILTTARATMFRFRFVTQFQATPTLAAGVDLYLKTSDGTHLDNDDGTGDIAVSSANKLFNLHHLGSAICDEAAANIDTVLSGWFITYARYIHFVMWNLSGATTNATDSNSGLVMAPVVKEIA